MPDTIDGARRVMASNNIPTSFLDKAYKMVEPFAGIAGKDPESIRSDIESLKGNKNPNITPPKMNQAIFDRARYPKL